MKQRVLKVNASDNVIVALQPLAAGEEINYAGKSYVLPRAIPSKHKFVTDDLSTGDAIMMYGVLVERPHNQ